MKLNEKQEQMKLAAIEFSNGEPMEEILKKYGVCYASVYNALKKHNISYEYPGNRKNNFDSNYFKKIDSQEKAYWYGFLLADGCIALTCKSMKSPNRLQVTLSSKDVEHLDKFKRAIKTESKINTRIYPSNYGNSEASTLNINSIVLCNQLMSYGFTQNKSILSHIPNIETNLYRHFIRGYFDGDGCICAVKRGGKTCYEFSITSNETVVSEIQNKIIEELRISKTKLKTYKRTTHAVSLIYGGIKNIKKLYEYLYVDSEIHLERKKVVFEKAFKS